MDIFTPESRHTIRLRSHYIGVVKLPIQDAVLEMSSIRLAQFFQPFLFQILVKKNLNFENITSLKKKLLNNIRF